MITKTKFYERLRGQFNARQEKVMARMFKEGMDGFKGGLSAENYIAEGIRFLSHLGGMDEKRLHRKRKRTRRTHGRAQ